jgi:hypothetical protein
MDITNRSAKDRIEFQRRIIRIAGSAVWQTCLNCEEWQQPSEGQDPNCMPTGCRRFQAMPPPEVIVNGCEWHIMDIPF